MQANKQSYYELPYTGNYFDQIMGAGYRTQPITFHEFLSKPESLFLYDSAFMQIPAYIQEGAEIKQIEEAARGYVAEYIMKEFEHNLLGMQDYARWATLFEHKCASLAPSFWAQVNMYDLMFAKDLQMDDNTISRTNTGNAIRLGGQTVVTDQNAASKTSGKTSSSQDISNTQETDTSTRESTATVVSAADQLADDLKYNWNNAADNIHEIRNRAGDTKQHMDSVTNSESSTESSSHSVSTTSMNNSNDQSENNASETSSLTNKMFMQERQWAINTARDLFPLEWLRTQLRPMFYMIY